MGLFGAIIPGQEYEVVIGAKGIGQNIVEHLVKEGLNVISRSFPQREYLVIKNLITVPCDLSILKNRRGVQSIESKNIKISGLVNNAGYSEWRSIERIDEKFVDMMLRKNLYTCISTIKYVLKYSREIKSIVNISSLAGKRGTANNLIYVSSKFAIEGLTRALSQELGVKGIRVNSICPVLIKTPGLISEIENLDGPARDVGIDKFLEFSQTQTALKRLPNASDVSSLVSFLLSNKSNSITGQSINVDCGVLPG